MPHPTQQISSVRQSHAGHDFHFLFAVQRLLELLDPASSLTAVKIEELSAPLVSAEAPEAALMADLVCYYGGRDERSAHEVWIEQFKYAVSPNRSSWTGAKLKSEKGKKGVLPRFANAWRESLDAGWSAGVRFRLVSNVSVSDKVTNAIQSLRSDDEARSGFTKDEAAMMQAAGISETESVSFFRALDLEDCGTGSRTMQKVQIFGRLRDHFPNDPVSAFEKLKQFVWDRAGIEGHDKKPVDRDDLLGLLGTHEHRLFPCPACFLRPPTIVPTTQAGELATLVAQSTYPIVVHADAGMGKSTALQILEHHLPLGSVVVLFDCYGGGVAGTHRLQRTRTHEFVIQVTNELATRGKARLLIQPSPDGLQLLRDFEETLSCAAREIGVAGGKLVIAADAVDDACKAKKSDDWFLPDLVDMKWPANCVLVLSSRTGNLKHLNLPINAERFQIRGFTENQTASHLRSRFPTATDEDCQQFHLKTGGADAADGLAAPRVQAYALSEDRCSSIDQALANAKGGWTEMMSAVKADFLNHFGEGDGQRALAIVDLFVPGASLHHFGKVWNMTDDGCEAALRALGPGLLVEAARVRFRDRDFEEDFRRLPTAASRRAAHEVIGRTFMVLRDSDPFAAERLAEHLFEAGMAGDLLELAFTQPVPPEDVIADPRLRSQAAMRRVRLALSEAARLRRFADVTELCLIGAELSRDGGGLNMLVHEAPWLAAEFLGTEAVGEMLMSGEDSHRYPVACWRFAQVLGREERNLDRAVSFLRKGAAAVSAAKSKRQRQMLSPFKGTATPLGDYVHACYAIGGLTEAIAGVGRWRAWTWSGIVDDLRERAADFLEKDERIAVLLNEDIPMRFRCQFAASFWKRVGWFCTDSLPAMIAWLSKLRPGKRQKPAVAVPDIIAVCEAAIAAGLEYAPIAEVLRSHQPRIAGWEWQDWHSWRYDPQWRAALVARALLKQMSGGTLTDDEIEAELREDGDNSARQPDYMVRYSLSRAVNLAVCVAYRLGPRSSAAEQRVHLTAYVERLAAEDCRNWEEFQAREERLVFWIKSFAWAQGAESEWLFRFVLAAASLQQGSSGELTWLRELAEAMSGFTERLDYRDVAHSFLIHCLKRGEQASCEQESKRNLFVTVARVAKDTALRSEAWEMAVRFAGHCGQDDTYHLSGLLDVSAVAGRSSDAPEFPELAKEIVSWAERFRQVADSKHFPEEAIFATLATLHFPSALATLGRWMDGARCGASPLLPEIVSVAVRKQLLSPAESYALLHTAMPNGVSANQFTAILKSHPRQRESDLREKHRLLQAMAEFVLRDLPSSRKLSFAEALVQAAESESLGAVSCVQRLRELIRFLAKDRPPEPKRPAPAFRNAAAPSDQFSSPPDWTHLASWARQISSEERHEAGRALEYWTSSVRPEDTVSLLDGLHSLCRERYWGSTVLRLARSLLERNLTNGAVRSWCREHLVELGARCLGEVSFWERRKVPDVFLPFAAADMSENDYFAEILKIAAREADHWVPFLNCAATAGLLIGPQELANRVLLRLRWASSRWFSNDSRPYAATDAAAPATIHDAVAGFYWASFAHPDKPTRYRAMYAALETARQGMETCPVLDSLIEKVKETDTGAFRDPEQGSCFWMSARIVLWRLLRRLAHDQPERLVRHSQLLLQSAFDTSLPHALILELARGTLLALEERKPGSYSTAELRRISKLNRPSKVIEGLDEENHRAIGSSPSNPKGKLDEETRFRFDETDTVPSWYESVMRVFGMRRREFLNLADAWITDHWQMQSSDSYWGEPRSAHYRYNDPMQHSRRQGHDPELETLHTYLEFHAMFCVAGDLVTKGRPVEKAEEWERIGCSYLGWLDRWLGPDRALIRWGRDLLTPPPFEPLAWGLLPSLEQVAVPVNHEEFDTALRLDWWQKDWIVVEGHWGARNHELHSRVEIHCCLVAEELATSLMATLQIRRWPFQQWMPQIKEWDYRAESFLESHFKWQPIAQDVYRDPHWSAYDPFAKQTSHQWISLSPFVVEQCAAVQLPGEEYWSAPGFGPIAVGHRWSDAPVTESRHRESGASGHFLRFRVSVLLQLLRSTKSAAIILVSISRDEEKQTYVSGAPVYHPERNCALYYILRSDTTLANMAKACSLGEPVAGQPWPDWRG